MYTEEQKTKIYEDFSPKVIHYIYGKTEDYQLAEDMCSDVFIKVYSHLDSFDSSKASLSTWIYHITQNTLYDYYRTRKIYTDIDEVYDLEDSKASVEDSICREESLAELAEALQELDERLRNIVVLHYYDGYTLKVIAEKMGLSYNYVKVLHKDALNKLQKKMNIFNK